MKTIGLLGGMSWESTVSYYQIINETVKRELGGLHSAKCILYSVDFEEIEKCQSEGNWAKSGEILAAAARALEKAGADFILICTNTMHKVSSQVEEAVSVPLLHIADVTSDSLLEIKIHKVALLGTKYTMEQDFYKAKLIEKGIEVLIPEEKDRNYINDVIFRELCLGIIKEESRERFIEIIEKLGDKGAQGAILGCTEIGLLVNDRDTYLPLFDTALIHAQSAAYMAMEKDKA